MTITVAIKLNGGAAGAPLSCAAGAAVTATLDSVAGVNSVAWTIAAADDLSEPGDYTLVQSGLRGETVDFNALATLGTAAILQAVVNADPTLYARAKFFVPAANGMETGADGEGYEGDATHGTARISNEAIRASGTGAYCPAARVLTAGTGMTGGGDMSADRTFNVVANADGSIVANANDIQVGILATDAQHGNRGGGGIHANVVSAGAAGFMTGADKAILDAATSTATASVIAKWDASKYLQAAKFNGEGTVSTAGVLNTTKNVTQVAAKNNGGTADLSLVTTTAADATVFGDVTNGASADLIAKSAGFVRSMVGTFVATHSTASGTAFGAAPDFAGGVGVLGIADATTEPTTVPGAGSIVAWAKSGQVKAVSPKGLVSTLSTDASGVQTLSISDRLWWIADTTDDVATVVGTYGLAVPEGGQFSVELWVVGVADGTDTRVFFKLYAGGGRAPAGATVVDFTSGTTALLDAIGVAGPPTVTISANAVRLNARGKAATNISWTFEGTIRIWKA